MSKNKTPMILFLVFSFVLISNVFSQHTTGNKKSTIESKIDSLIQASSLLRTTEVGIIVYDLTSKSDIYRYQAEKLYRPASVEKVITSVTALSVLGKDYKLNTGLSYSGYIEGDTLHGNLYIKGDFDPEFTEDNLKSMAESVVNSGVKYINGRLIGDISMMDSVYWGPGWAWDDSPDSFQPYLSPLMLNKGCVGVSISPTSRWKNRSMLLQHKR